jgi:formylglycine-generating enzyme required for sulfatase activity
MLRSLVLIFALLLAAPALAQTADDAAANRLFVEAVQLWNRAEFESVEQRAATLQRVQANLKTILDRHGGSALAVRLVIGETVGPLSVQGVERALRNPQMLLQPSKVFRDCSECPEMVVVPAGAASLASGRNVTIAAPFAVGKFEVTFAEWDACVSQGGCIHRPDDRGWGRGRQPVMNVSWHDAQDYIAWLSKRTGKAYRLLSEAEWEYAAQAGSGREAVATPGAGQANCVGCGSWDAGHLWDMQAVPAGRFAADAFGLHDMLGNVSEWTADCWNDSHAGAPADGSARLSGDCSLRVLRGGSWYYLPMNTRSANRDRLTTDLRLYFLGFRVARTL